MGTTTAPLQQIAEIASASKSFRMSSAFELPGGASLEAEIHTNPSWIMLYLREVTGNRAVANQHYHSGFSDLADAMARVARDYPKASPKADSVSVHIEKGPTTGGKAGPIAVQAWHETFGLPIPSLEDLAQAKKAAKKAAKAAEKAEAAAAIELLKSGPEGVAKFSRRSLESRSGLDFRKADFAGCNLDGAMLNGLNLEGADFTGASLTKASLSGSGSAAVKLKGAKFIDAKLDGAALHGSRCADANFSGADLGGAKLRYSSLLRTRFIGANLQKVDFTGVDFAGADFNGASLTDAIFEQGTFDQDTKWPKGFKIPDSLTWKGAGADPRRAPTKREKALPKPTDFAGFLDRLKNAADPGKLAKAMSMLKKDRFRLFAKVEGDHLSGVVKSQSDPDLVYSCRIADDGTYACCTQNLNICGGLRGSPCKHLLVLIVGLAKAGELDPSLAHDWTQSARGQKPELDKDAMTETLLQYKGAEAGEVDWRPTETIPEDFYAM